MGEFLTGLGIVVGVFLGVVGGTAVNLVIGLMNQKRSENKKLANLKFELELNIKKLDTWLGYVTEWRTYVGANTPARFLRYFDLSKMVFFTANDMWASGLLYDHLDHEDVGALQDLGGRFNQFYESTINSQAAQHKTGQVAQGDAIGQIDFWDNQLKGHKDTLETLLRKLS